MRGGSPSQRTSIAPFATMKYEAMIRSAIARHP